MTVGPGGMGRDVDAWHAGAAVTPTAAVWWV